MIASRTYGGSFSWVGVPYKMKIERGIAPLQWMNSLAKNLLMLEDLVMAVDGTFYKPGESTPMFPRGGIDLRWEWDGSSSRLVIHFWNKGELLASRWDELIPDKECRFPSLAPDFQGVGHVGRFSFKYQLISVPFDQAMESSSFLDVGVAYPVAVSSHLPSLPGKLAGKSRGKCIQVQKPSAESRRDFARLVSDDPQFSILCESLGVSQPLSARDCGCGDLTDNAVNEAIAAVREQVNAILRCVDKPELTANIFEEIVAYAAVGTGLDFAISQDLLPVFLQPSYVLVCFGEPLQLRLVTYGYVAGKPADLDGFRPSEKSTPFLVRLVSPELAMQSASSSYTSYAARIVSNKSMLVSMAFDDECLYKAVSTCSWEPIL